jgi:excisionase family DNA binding protein
MVVEAVRLYSVASVAELLEVSKDYVYDRIKSGVLAVVELGDERAKQRIRADVLQAFIDSRSYGHQNRGRV